MNHILDLLQARACRDDCGIYWEEAGTYTSYARLLEQAAVLATDLAPWRGRAVLLVGDNGWPLVATLLACWWAGCVPAALPPPARLQKGNDYAHWLGEAARAIEAEVGLAEERWLERCQKAPLPSGWRPMAREPREAYPSQGPSPGPEGIAYWQFSSGTTLRPRPTGLTHGNLLSNLEAIASQHPGGRQGHSCCSWLPLYHDMGLIGGWLSSLYCPGSLSLLTPTQFALRPGLWLDKVAERRATYTLGPNFALQQLLQRDTSTERDLSALQRFLLGGETLYPSVLDSFQQRYRGQGLRAEALTPVYGLAEATLAVTFGHGPRTQQFQVPDQIGARVEQPGNRRLLSLGRPLPGVEVTIAGAPEQGYLGQICVAGPGLAAGLPSPYPTGDLGFLWEGELYFVTRLKDVVIYQGRNHDPELAEERLLPLTSALVECPQSRPALLVERPRRGEPPTSEQLDARLQGLPYPVQIELRPYGWLPRTSSGKISRYQSRLRYWAECGYEP